ncbi:acetyl-CoA carboxylase biotin carboxyl carrier protein [Macrococcus sp. EM39E]|uniref:acetyl-CoA carboxylase biotin carboxyl carrier protein n=1 Tax=Macrococcus animalis TaxID=3395467 RepID=UPI0039BECB14
MNSDKLQQLIDMMNSNELNVISIKEGDNEYYIEKAIKEVHTVPTQIDQISGQNVTHQETVNNNHHVQKSQLVGTFYNMQDETSKEPFIRVGDKVEKGDRIGIIEAMKVMNDIFADVDGVIEAIHIENGTAVGYDEPLVTIKEK